MQTITYIPRQIKSLTIQIYKLIRGNKNNLNEVKGYELKPPCPCDQCVTETDKCRKLILAGGEHVCASPKDIDWEQRRYEIAKNLLPTVNEAMTHINLADDITAEQVREVVAETVIEFADALIKKLKE